MNVDLIREAQMLLNGHGYGPLNVDGIADPRTIDAIKAFQESINHEVTGIVDNKTRDALRDVGSRVRAHPVAKGG